MTKPSLHLHKEGFNFLNRSSCTLNDIFDGGDGIIRSAAWYQVLIGSSTIHFNFVLISQTLDLSVSAVSGPQNARRSDRDILLSFNLKRYTFAELEIATGNFHPYSITGDGGFGLVYKGWIHQNSLAATKPGTGIAVAVKRLRPKSLQGHREWLAEVNYLGKFSHPNLVRLIGYCLEDECRLLVYELMPLGSLEDHLFSRYRKREPDPDAVEPLSWSIRLKVSLDVAKVLAFLHSATTKVIYRDFKTSNILLDSDYNAKLSDFGLARDGPNDNGSHVSTRIMGIEGYADPEYVDSGHLTTKSDVYSFGVVLLEILTGELVLDMTKYGSDNLVEYIKPHLADKTKIFGLLDSELKGQYLTEEAYKVATLALQCLSLESKFRPNMDEVVRTLEKLQVPNLNVGNLKHADGQSLNLVELTVLQTD
ncbi:receptor-like cytoplasmic kinase 176 [Trifolium pratense]|uniref:receptor-like cytoplasmic kinase 176 n=1 Tax=Trifolium pratense TaxID=57577 RepID=UPI001E691B6C|nr:receptor-like cytoplasmic kinase 176 [Trifolium pratense]